MVGRGRHITRRFVAVSLGVCAALVACSGRARPSSMPGLRGMSSVAAVPPVRRTARTVRIFEQHQLALRDSLVRLALAQVGTRYEFGGATPQRGFDCSGFVRFVFAELYLNPPRLAARQARFGAAIPSDAVRPGDVLSFGVGDSVTHVGIYVGERKFVHASSVAGRVIVSSLDRPPSDLVRPLRGARRLIAISTPIEERYGGG